MAALSQWEKSTLCSSSGSKSPQCQQTGCEDRGQDSDGTDREVEYECEIGRAHV